MARRPFLLSLSALALAASVVGAPGDALEAGFASPPPQARIRAYWWWLNGNVTKAGITRDLEAMAAKGWGGALLCDAGGAEQDGNAPVPHGPTFLTAEWRELYRHALAEADRLGLELSLNIQSGWNLGGPMVGAEDAPKKLGLWRAAGPWTRRRPGRCVRRPRPSRSTRCGPGRNSTRRRSSTSPARSPTRESSS
jgi:hypothetical protein